MQKYFVKLSSVYPLKTWTFFTIFLIFTVFFFKNQIFVFLLRSSISGFSCSKNIYTYTCIKNLICPLGAGFKALADADVKNAIFLWHAPLLFLDSSWATAFIKKKTIVHWFFMSYSFYKKKTPKRWTHMKKVATFARFFLCTLILY